MTKVSFVMSILRLWDCQFPESKSALVIADLQSAEYQVDLRQTVTIPDAGSVLMPEKLCNALPPVEELKKLLKMNKRKYTNHEWM